MSDTEAASPPDAEKPPVSMAPFDFWPTHASRIGGIGGTQPAEDPAYVFHTSYADLPPGGAECTITFTGLTATLGTLTVRINVLPPDEEPRASTVQSWSLHLPKVVEDGGVAKLAFRVEPGHRYAVLGHIYTETDARAEGLAIEVAANDRSTFFEDQLLAARKTTFGQRVFRRASRMLDTGKATLSDPVSQTCTAAQFDEPEYREALEWIKAPWHRHRKQWEFIYILRALQRYGMLREGARGIGFGVGIEPLPAAMAAMGCDVVATDLAADDERVSQWSVTHQHAAELDQLRNPAICPDDRFGDHVQFRPVDMNAIPADLVDFDFTWSSCSLEHLGSIQAGLDFIRNSVSCLKFGGLAVHTTELNLTSNEDTIDTGGTVLFRRRDMERLAMDLVSRGHYVAQLKFDLGDKPLDAYVDVPPYASDDHLKLALASYVSTSFGIIVRRGDR